MSPDLRSSFEHVAKDIDTLFRSWLEELPQKSAGEKKLHDSISYTLLNAGKRFRPALSVWVGDAYGGDKHAILNYAAAVEMIHTYSLIHDDLPCMDDDDMRRGQLANHKKYGEEFALLAGDALLTAAFHLVLLKCGDRAAEAAIELAVGSGVMGMVGGQAIDLLGQKSKLSSEEIERLHNKKTGALIVSSVRGAAKICGVKAVELDAITDYSEKLGFAFQIADDILDYEQSQRDFENIVTYRGLEGATKLLNLVSQKAQGALEKSNCKSMNLLSLIEYNLNREK